MSAEVFLDTNVVVYAFDKTAPKKQACARELLNVDANWAISWQVIQEFSNVALHRFAQPVTTDFLNNFIDLVLWPKCVVFPSRELNSTALRLQHRTQYRYYDSLILASAIESGATTLLSEDLQAGRQFGNLTIQNPFN